MNPGYGNANSNYPKLDPSSPDYLKIWVYLCANFRYTDSLSLADTAKNLMTFFYMKHFPKSIHKISEADS